MKSKTKLFFLFFLVLFIYIYFKYRSFEYSIIAVLAAGIIIFWLKSQWKKRKKKPKRVAIPESVKDEVLRRQGGTCLLCAERSLIQYHHKIPVHKGGSSLDSMNIVAVCPTHHSLLHAQEEGKKLNVNYRN